MGRGEELPGVSPLDSLLKVNQLGLLLSAGEVGVGEGGVASTQKMGEETYHFGYYFLKTA